MTDIATTAPTDMTEEEGKRLIELEREVEKAMRSAGRIAGAALREIKDRRLYRASHRSFEQYVLDRHGLSRSTAYRMMEPPESTNGLPPAAAAIGAASAKASQRRHTTLDQPPATIDPEPEVLEPRVRPEPLLTPPPMQMPTPPPPKRAVGRPMNPDGERARQRAARDALNRIIAIITTVNTADLLEVALEGDRTVIIQFATPFIERQRGARREEDAIDPKTCPHPANRRLGDTCGRCGARKAKP